MILYEKKGCWHCKLVDEEIAKLGMNPTRKYISDEEVVKELIAKGGKRQVPYMIDEEKGVSMYESEEIVRYLEKTYGAGVAPAPVTAPLHA